MKTILIRFLIKGNYEENHIIYLYSVDSVDKPKSQMCQMSVNLHRGTICSMRGNLLHRQINIYNVTQNIVQEHISHTVTMHHGGKEREMR